MQRELPRVGKAYRAAFTPQLRSIDEKARTIEFVASTEAVDRYGDVIRVAGWKLDAYKKNPVFLWAHKSGEPPIGKTVGIHVETAPVPALVQRVEFADAATYPFADTIFNLYKGKFLRAVSVGFMPLEMPKRIKDAEDNTTGYEFTSQELLELSAVPVPANPEAVARMVSKGFASERDLQRVFSASSAEDAYRELAEINHEVARIAVGLAKKALLAAGEVRALLEAARLNSVNLTADLTLPELLAAIRGSGAAAEEGETLEANVVVGDISTLDQLAAAVGSEDGPFGIEEMFSDSRSLRTGKFKFALRPELR